MFAMAELQSLRRDASELSEHVTHEGIPRYEPSALQFTLQPFSAGAFATPFVGGERLACPLHFFADPGKLRKHGVHERSMRFEVTAPRVGDSIKFSAAFAFHRRVADLPRGAACLRDRDRLLEQRPNLVARRRIEGQVAQRRRQQPRVANFARQRDCPLGRRSIPARRRGPKGPARGSTTRTSDG